MEVDLADRANNHDETTAAEVVGLLAGVGVLLMQAAAMMPGLLPVLLLLLPIVLPVVALGLAAGIVVGVPYALWRVTTLILGPLTRRNGRRSIADALRDVDPNADAIDTAAPEPAASP
jgi:hypothetical protein